MVFETALHILSTNIICYSIILFITSAALIIASISDIRTREVPDILNYGLIFAGIGLRFIYSAITLDWNFAVAGLAGFGTFFVIALVLFYTGQWGGGDSKLLMGMGALFGLELRTDEFIISFIVNMFVAGAAYGFLWSIGLLIMNRKKFLSGFRELSDSKNTRRLKIAMLLILFLLLIAAIIARNFRYSMILFGFTVILYFTFYLWLFIKTIENVCMIKRLPVRKLTEGDWIADNVYVHGKYICGPKDLGIEKDQIAKLKRLKIRFILVKEGIPFIPSFLIGFFLTMAFGNWWMNFL